MRNHFRSASGTDPSGPPTPDPAVPFFQQRKSVVSNPPPSLPGCAPTGVVPGGPDEQQIEDLRTLLTHIAPNGHEVAFNPYPRHDLLVPSQENSAGSESSRNASTPSLEGGERHHGSAGLVPEGESVEVVEMLVEHSRAKGKQRATRPSSMLSQGIEARLVSNLSASNVQFVVSNQEPTPPSLDQLRDRIVKQHRFLGQRVEPGAQERKPHQNPPAVDKAVRARFKPVTPEKEQARLGALKLQVESTLEQSVARGIVVLEKRETVWKPLAPEPPAERADMLENVERTPALPSAWLLPIDSSSLIASGKPKNKKLYRLAEFEAMAGCSSCDAKGQCLCPLCRGAEPDECFWCEGTGIRKRKTCDNCNGRKIHACLKCNARGTIDCKECNGNGKVYVGAFAEVKVRTVTLPPIAVKDLIHPATGRPPATNEEVEQCAKIKMSQTTAELSRLQGTKPSPSVPVLARCTWHKSVKRIVTVWRPAHVEVPGQRKLSFGRKRHDRSDEGQAHRFLVPSDRGVPIVEIPFTATVQGVASSSTQPSTPTGLSSSVTNSPSTSRMHTPSASIANLRSLWRRSQTSVNAQPSSSTSAHAYSPNSAPHTAIA